jgi:tetratricopeptide (TPR) repeat protein
MYGVNSLISGIPHRFRAPLYLAGTLFLLLIPAVSLAQNRPPSSFSHLAENARKASEENRLDDAVVLYTKALAVRPRWSEGWWSLGTLEYDQNHYAKAAHAFTKLIALEPRNGTAHAMLGLCDFELNRDDSALKNLLAAERFGVLKDEQLRKVALYHLGLLQLRQRKFNAAMETLLQLAKDHLKTKELVLALGQAALLIRPQDAPAEGDPGSVIVERAGQAELLFAEKNFDGARQILTGLVTEYPTYPNVHVAHGRFLLEMHEIDEGVKEFQAEIKNNPQNVPARLQIAAVRYRLDSADGLKYAKEAVQLDPRDPFAHYLLGLLYLDTQAYAEAISELETAKRSGFASVAELYFALGNAYARAGRSADAARARETFAKLKAENKDENGELQSRGLTSR